MSFHEKYIEGGEKVYAPKVDSVLILPGHDRILLKCWLKNSSGVQTVTVSWNGEQGSIVLPVTPQAGLDSIETFLPDLLEGAYSFVLFNTDVNGNQSLKVSASGESYGNAYQNSLINRKVKNATISGGARIINWLSAQSDLVGTEIRYTTNEEETETLFLPASASSITCPDAKAQSTFTYRSLYLPVENCIDTFYVAWEEKQFP
jgi:hypothetical protein